MTTSYKDQIIVDGVVFDRTVEPSGRVTVTHPSYGSASKSPLQYSEIAMDLAHELLEKAKSEGT